MVDMLLKIHPTLKEHIITRGQYKSICGKLDSAVYGTLLGAIYVFFFTKN